MGMLALIAGLTGIWVVGSAMTGATNASVEPAPAPATEIRLTTSDQVEIAASYWKADDSTAPAILLLHGNGGNRRDMLDMATWWSRPSMRCNLGCGHRAAWSGGLGCNL